MQGCCHHRGWSVVLRPFSLPYSPECVEGVFSEVRQKVSNITQLGDALGFAEAHNTPLQASFRPRGAGGRRHRMDARMDTIPGST